MVNVIEAGREQIEELAEQYEALRKEQKALEEQTKALAKAMLNIAKEQALFEIGDDGKARLHTKVASYTLSQRVTETFIDAFKAYRVLKLISLKVLASVITFDKAKMALALQEGRLTEEQYALLRDDVKVSEYLTPGRPTKK